MDSLVLIWIGRALSGLTVLFLLTASVAPKLLNLKVSTDTLVTLGWNPRHVFMLGLIELIITVLYAVPKTAFLGGILITAFLGGAIATNWRADQPLFSHVLFGVYLGLAMWGGLWLRDPALRALLPLRTL